MGVSGRLDERLERGAVWRALAMLAAMGLSAAVSVGVSPGVQMGTRAVLWGGVGVMAIVLTRSGRRPEPPAAWGSFGTGMVLIGISWYVRATDADLQEIGNWPDVLSVLGLVCLGLGLFYAGRGPRERIALFDGALVAGAVTTVVWAVLLAQEMSGPTTSAARIAAVSHVLGAVLVLGLGAALMLADRETRRVVGPQLSVMLVALQLAAIGWGWQRLAGLHQEETGAISWVLVPLVVLSIALTRDAPLPDVHGPGRTMTPTRFRVLVGLAVFPAALVGVMHAWPGMQDTYVPVTMGLWMTVASVIVLALRIRAVANFAVEDERAASSDRFGHLIQHSADVVAVVSVDGTIQYLSPSTRRVFAHEPEALVGRHVSHFIEDASHDRITRLLEIALEGQGRPVPIRIGVLAGDGMSRPAEGSITDLTAIPSVGGLVVTLRDVSARVALEADLRRAALEDPLTGLANRTLLTDRIQHALGQQSRRGLGVALLFLDLDDFKAVNDTHGHAAGDRILKIVASRLGKVIRDVDTVGRIGGDEFAIVLEGLDPDDVVTGAQEVVERLLEEFATPVAVGGAWIEIAVSIGIAVARPDMTLEALMQNADMAMYSAKAAGGARSSVFGPGMATHLPGAEPTE